jgi:hypothetical protein
LTQCRKHQLGVTYQQLNSSNQILKSRIQLTELLTLPEFQLQCGFLAGSVYAFPLYALQTALKPVYKSKQQGLRAYCPNINTVSIAQLRTNI